MSNFSSRPKRAGHVLCRHVQHTKQKSAAALILVVRRRLDLDMHIYSVDLEHKHFIQCFQLAMAQQGSVTA